MPKLLHDRSHYLASNRYLLIVMNMNGVGATIRHSLRPSYYDEHTDVVEPSLGKACSHLVLLCLMLSLPATAGLIVRIAPALVSVQISSVLDGAVRLFPSGVEILLNQSALHLRPAPSAVRPEEAEAAAEDGDGSTYVCWEDDASSWCAAAPQLEPIRLELHPLLHDVCFTDLPAPLHLSPTRLAALWNNGLEALVRDEDERWGGFPPLVEFEVGEVVEVKLHSLASMAAPTASRLECLPRHPLTDPRILPLP